jgi:hypothetical protein
MARGPQLAYEDLLAVATLSPQLRVARFDLQGYHECHHSISR